MRSGALVLLAILLGVFLAVGQCGSGSADEKSDDDKKSSSSKSDDDHEDREASDSHDESDSDKDEDKKDDKKDEDKKDDSKDSDEDAPQHAEDMKKHLESQDLTVAQMSTSADDDCAAHSYGEVSDYFSDHPCHRMERAWYEVRDDQDNAAVVSVAWVEMADAEAAGDLQRLVDKPGTGNVTELSKEDGPYQDVSYSGWYYRSSRNDDLFQSVQAEPLADNQGSRDLARRAAGATATD